MFFPTPHAPLRSPPLDKRLPPCIRPQDLFSFVFYPMTLTSTVRPLWTLHPCWTPVLSIISLPSHRLFPRLFEDPLTLSDLCPVSHEDLQWRQPCLFSAEPTPSSGLGSCGVPARLPTSRFSFFSEAETSQLHESLTHPSRWPQTRCPFLWLPLLLVLSYPLEVFDAPCAALIREVDPTSKITSIALYLLPRMLIYLSFSRLLQL